MIHVALAAARAAAAVIDRANAADRAGFQRKGPVDLVTAIDLAAEEAIREVLARETPGIPVFAEEGGGAADASTRWIVDPIDGTTNFVHGYPFYAVSIALQVDGEVVAACTFDAVRHHALRAAKGEGAFLDDVPIHVSATPDLDRALVVSGFPYDRRQKAAYYLRFVEAFLTRTQGFRRSGSACMDLVHLAMGLSDGYWELGLKPWDMAAGSLLVREAGGTVTDFRGSALRLDGAEIVASNGRVHEEMLEVIAGVLGRA